MHDLELLRAKYLGNYLGGQLWYLLVIIFLKGGMDLIISRTLVYEPCMPCDYVYLSKRGSLLRELP